MKNQRFFNRQICAEAQIRRHWQEWGIHMTAISVTKARENIYQILSDVNSNSQPITITNNRGKNGVLISEDDWNAIQETLYLNSIPGMAESIIEAGKEPLDECPIYRPDEEW